ncbi:hypothetical protein [Ponticoccus alexandrii]|uniref:Uncharacterized protein n=1 Tax=Ponticoccus alexandrii TaxID=1943633 RepID=A0ABX7FAG5_9RHOB|nr:hypothetical protein [Ponticoccus alexandrii]QRF66357.1 hypothetical protein GQA70_08570 [Ponticoccus alexandrii]
MTFLAGFVLLFFRRRRKVGLLMLLASPVAFIGAALMFLQSEATNAGWDSFNEKREAEEAGISDPAIWQTERDRLRAEREAQDAADAARRDAEAAERAEAEARRKAEEERRRAEERAAADARAAAEAAERAAEKQAEEAEEAAKAEADRIAGFHCLSRWDGSHRDFRNAVRDAMRDPDSFEVISTRVTPVAEDGTHVLMMEYRARNGFGGMNVASAIATMQNADCTFTILTIE